jgi:isoquinoline 1-oxidoreductase alpha subunit
MRAMSSRTAASVASSFSVRASSNSSPESASPESISVSVPTTPSSAFFSLPSACARSASSQTFGSSSSRATSVSRAALTSKSKIPPHRPGAFPKARERIGDLVQCFGFHGDPARRQMDAGLYACASPARRRASRQRTARALCAIGNGRSMAYHSRPSPPRAGSCPELPMPTLFINKERVDIASSVPGDTPLLWILRDFLSMTGTKYGCGIAVCGACTVWIEGQPVRACATPLSSLKQGVEITTIEGAKTKEAAAVQAAWEKLDVPQCGYCQSGQVMAAAALLAKKKRPTDADIDEAMTGILCRCATYPRIRAAIKEAAKALG